MRLQRRARLVDRGGHGFPQHPEQRLQVRGVRQLPIGRPVERRAPDGRHVNDRELDLLLARVQVDEQLVAGVQDLPRSGRRGGVGLLDVTRMTGRLASSVLRSTNLVWGSGPSLASTSRMARSTIDSPRSTSPPKSAWPGVSTMLMTSPSWWTAVFLARMVMPSFHSQITRVHHPIGDVRSGAERADCHSMASTRVVLPWSTCATIATFLISSRTPGPVQIHRLVRPGRDQWASREARSVLCGEVPPDTAAWPVSFRSGARGHAPAGTAGTC